MKETSHPAMHHFLMHSKVSCWYCNRQLAESGRFCDKVCAEAFDEDDMAMERRLLASTNELIAGLVARCA